MLPAITDRMAGRVEDLICWQRADELRQLIIKHTADDTRAGKDFRFTNNLRDAIASVCRNQSEGFAKYKHKPQKPYFNTARSSLAEVKDGIRDGLQRGYFSDDVANLRYLKSLDRPDPE